jgi:hypothetical protein
MGGHKLKVGNSLSVGRISHNDFVVTENSNLIGVYIEFLIVSSDLLVNVPSRAVDQTHTANVPAYNLDFEWR